MNDTQLQTGWTVPIKVVPNYQSTQQVTSTWNAAHVCYEQSMFGEVTRICFNEQSTQVGAVSTNQTTLLRLPPSEGAVWNEQTAKGCFSLRFRKDGKLVVQGRDNKVIIRSTETNFERRLPGHSGDVRDAIFLTNQQVLSCSDDSTIRLWDLTAEMSLAASGKGGHKDYVRSLVFINEQTVASGGYDHRFLLWDLRSSFEKPVKEWNLGEQISAAVLLSKRGGLGQVAVAAGDVVHILDLQAMTDKPLFSASNHTKTVTGLGYAPALDVLVSASLDKRVKFLSTKVEDEFNVFATRKFPMPLSSVGVSKTGLYLGVGNTSGQFELLKTPSLKKVAAALRQTEEEQEQEGVETQKNVVVHGDAFLQLQSREHFEVEDVAKMSTEEKKMKAFHSKMREIRHDFLSYQYRRSLRTALYSQMPDVLFSTVEELQRRGALRVAMSGHNDRSIVQLLRFVTAFVDVPDFTSSCILVLDIIFEIYGEMAAKSPFFHRELMIAQRQIGDSLAAMDRLLQSVGMMEVISGV